jgi:hypothetical protein
MKSELLSVDQARALAEAEAERELSTFANGEVSNYLRDEFLEADNCWMFFRNLDVDVPQSVITPHFAYAVSKHGEMRLVPDLSSDRSRVLEYVKTMSAYFSRKNL